LISAVRSPTNRSRARCSVCVELFLAFQCDETLGWPCRRLGDGFRVAVVVLLRLQSGGEYPPQMMHPAACFHRHDTGRQSIGKSRKSLTLHPSAQSYLAAAVKTNNGADVLAQIDPENCDFHRSLLTYESGNPTMPEGGAGHPII
jgi:hypothetical protein